MTNSQLFRISGISLLIGAIAFIIHLVARSLLTAGLDPAAAAQQDLWVPMNALGVIGSALILLGLPALYTRIARSTAWMSLIGVALIALAWMFFGLFLSFYAMLVAPWLADDAPALASAPLPMGILIVFFVGVAAELIGTVLFAIPFIRGRVQPRWVGYALPASALLRVIGSFIAPSGPASNLAINLLSNLGPVLFAVVLGYLGSQMWSEDRSVQERSSQDRVLA